MKITLKLFATLGEYLPADVQGNELEVEVGKDTTVNDVIGRFNVPESMVHLVLLNGIYVDAEERSKLVMQTGDSLAIWPPVAGG